MKEQVQVTIHAQGRTQRVAAPAGENLLSLLQKQGVTIHAGCGGNGSCGGCSVVVNRNPALACQVRLQADMQVALPDAAPTYIASDLPQSGVLHGRAGLALDIGTTTLALALADLHSHTVVELFTADNPQQAYGADVMSRIAYVTRHGVQPLHDCLLHTIRQLIEAACEKYNIAQAETLYVAGNTAMLHLFYNVDCSSMGTAPYTPAFLRSQRRAGTELGLARCRSVRSLPCISAFIGADITAGLAGLPTPAQGKYSLLLDLGTNAEIALFSASRIVCTAAAAGPCFEGGNIACGMRAVDGAIYRIRDVEGCPLCETIGGKPAVGLCGTGLIDAMAFLRRMQKIDETGAFATGDGYTFADNVRVTQKDVRAFQNAKSAICSAMELLLTEAEVPLASVDTLYLSGGFSHCVDVINAARCGLIPKALAHKARAIANSSLRGTLQQLFGMAQTQEIPANYTVLDLAANPRFSARFMENMLFAQL